MKKLTELIEICSILEEDIDTSDISVADLMRCAISIRDGFNQDLGYTAREMLNLGGIPTVNMDLDHALRPDNSWRIYKYELDLITQQRIFDGDFEEEYSIFGWLEEAA